MKWKVPNIDNIEEIIFEYANGDFSNRLLISDRKDEGDVIAAGINMLGEELEEKSVSKNYLSNILDAIPIKIIVFTNDFQINFCNKRARDFFKVGNEQSLNEMLDKKLLEKLVVFVQEKKSTDHFEVQLQQKNAIRYLLCNLKRMTKVTKNQYLFVAKDISNEKNEERNLLKATLYGQDIERKRLAYDLHDTLGQELNAIKMYMNALKMMEKNSDAYQDSFLEVNRMLTETIDSVRKISFNLMPSFLDQNTLGQSINQLINRINLITPCNIVFDCENQDIGLPDKKDELFVYRIIQEFINNSLKYAEAKQILIRMSIGKYYFECSLEDDGKGFNRETTKISGINNIFQRLLSLHAYYEFHTAPGKGTKITFKFQHKI